MVQKRRGNNIIRRTGANEFVWAEALPIQGSVLKFVVLVWNEAVNIHQFILYAPLFMNQLWKGYVTAKDRHIEQHAAC